jgi:hypothetical protein
MWWWLSEISYLIFAITQVWTGFHEMWVIPLWYLALMIWRDEMERRNLFRGFDFLEVG